ncbi:hypothetical protein HK103_002330 [Boothiomyces macroporosus]|uniref:HMG box domain-containing protein n=1 Tax=Boothiomyces macroporosus TaxID=261099 RepID=A0AAD5Y9H9_9FUNG|nr:hypothetical protein HK103_002307 [Boothiomyces macroporosus]KAJ3259427.1 hypothetical protein HK103_002330 [Boothiomyces macroporosus]
MPKVTLKKPLNSFFLYRKSKKQEIIRNYHITKSHEISKKAAELWQLESREVKDYYAKLSLEEHNKFKEMNPDFDWQPWKKKRNDTKKDEIKSSLPPLIDPVNLNSYYPSPVESAIYFPLVKELDITELFTQEFNHSQANQVEPFNFEEFLDFSIC